MFRLVAAALLGGSLTIGLGWVHLGAGALVLAPFAASLSTLACAAILGRRESTREGSAARAERWIRDIQTGAPDAAANDSRTIPVPLGRHRA